MKGNKEDLLKLRVHGKEKQVFQRAADLSGISLSAWARERLRKIAINELKNTPLTKNIF